MIRLDADLRALIEDAHQLRELTKHPGWDVLIRRTLEWMRPNKDTVLNGRATSFDDYKMHTGKFIGAHFVLDLPAQIQENADRRRARLAEQAQQADQDDGA